MKGFFVAIEGIDGSGKTTQVQLLTKYLASKKIPVEVINFPRYGDNLYGKLIKRYLSGEFGSILDVNPYLMALSYAGDRLLAKPVIESWLSSGKIVIANRYTSSSKAHLSANLPKGKREGFMNWLNELEYQTNRLPKETLTILLKVDPKIGQQNSRKDNLPDIHETNLKHLEEADKIYSELSKAEFNWQVVNCMSNGKMATRESINQNIIRLLKQIKFYEH